MARGKTRNLNLDLIRCVALLMVPTMHSLDHTGLYEQQLSGLPDIIMMSVKILFTCCIPLYVLLTGYLCHQRRLSARYYLGLVHIFLVYFICGTACLLFEQFYGIAQRSIPEMISALLNYNCCDYAWYIMMYFGLFLMMPFLNMIYHGLESQKQKLALVLTFFALTALPSLLNLYVQLYSTWWARLYPLCYYFTGAYLSEYMPRLSMKKGLPLLAGLLALFSLFFYFHYKANGAALIGVYQDTFQVYCLAVLLFILLFNIRLDGLPPLLSRLIQRISDLTLPAYLLTWIADSIMYPILIANVPAGAARYKWLLLTVPISLISALLLAVPVDWLCRPIDRLVRRLGETEFFKNDPLRS